MKKSTLTQIVVILVFFAVLAAAGYFIWRSVSGSLDTRPRDVRGRVSRDGSQEQVYTHPDYGFTLRYPAGLKLGKFPEGEGEIILLQGANAPLTKGDGGIEGFQIFISPYKEKEEFSKEVILKADPKMRIENDKAISLGAEEISALVFDSVNDSGAPSAALGAGTHEVWFVADGNLYQCTSFKEYGEEMERILGSLRFN